MGLFNIMKKVGGGILDNVTGQDPASKVLPSLLGGGALSGLTGGDPILGYLAGLFRKNKVDTTDPTLKNNVGTKKGFDEYNNTGGY